MLASLLSQTVPIPGPGQEPWPWVAALAVSAVVFLSNKLLTYLANDAAEWKQQSKACTTDFGKTSDALRLANDAIQSGAMTSGQEFARLHEAISRIDRKLDGLAGSTRPPWESR